MKIIDKITAIEVCARYVWESLKAFFCGMRRPSPDQNDDDLSRVTSASSDTDSSNNTLSLSSQKCFKEEVMSPPCILQLLDLNECKQSSRKRKERQDSISSINQDRKLVRSNSEEYIPTNTDECEVIRRVSSHEDFKQVVTPESVAQPDNCHNAANVQSEADKYVIIIDNIKLSNHTKYRLSPVRDSKIKNENLDIGEHERQRNNERFSKNFRATPGRKALSQKKSKYSSANKWMKEKDENSCYKYDICSLKQEKRGFVSSKHKHAKNQKEKSIDQNEENSLTVETNPDDKNGANSNKAINPDDKEILPWNHTFQGERPIVCRRFAENTFDHVNNAEDKMTKVYSSPIPSNIYENATIIEHTLHQNKLLRDTIKKSASCYATPDEKIKQVNKRLILLKKRYSQYEESFELNHGHKPSQNDKMSHKSIKMLVSEISKLRKEKHNIRADTRNFIHEINTCSSSNITLDSSDDDIRLVQMKETLHEIEKRLNKKRSEEKRSLDLEQLCPDELIKEKTAVQKALLYLESIFGRPVSRDERDAARTLYDRYRAIKRLVNKNVTPNTGISELPTILEHEALAFTTETSSNEKTSFSTISVDSPTDTSDSIHSTDSTDTSSSMTENVHTMSVQELWTQIDASREEVKNLKKTIREFEDVFEEKNGRKMLKSDRKLIEETYNLYKQKKAKLRLLDALIKKHMSSF